MEKIQSDKATPSKVKASYQGLIRGLLDDQDYSNGGYFWHGTDFKGPNTPANKQFYKVGFKFTDKAHDIWRMGDKMSNDKKVPYKYLSTGAYGQTTFMKLSPDWQKSKGSNHWDGSYRKNSFRHVLVVFMVAVSFGCNHGNCKVSETIQDHSNNGFDFSVYLDSINTNNSILVKDSTKSDISYSVDMTDWLSRIEPTSIEIFKCQNNFYGFYVGQSKNPTGLDALFYHWLIVDNMKGVVIGESLNLSNSTKCVYTNSQNELSYITFNFAEEYFHLENREYIPIDIKQYILTSDTLTLNSNSSVKILPPW